MCILLCISLSSQAEIPPAPGLYDPVTLLSRTTGDLYPVFPVDANQIPPLDLDRTDDVDQALTILIQTPDIPFTYAPASFDSLLYSTGIYPTGSMNEYFMETSYGVFGVDGEVVGWFTAANNYSYYTYNNYGLGNYPHNAQMLVEEAVLAADAAGVDFSNYDNNGDGWVDALIVVHQGPGAEFTGSNDDIWSHRWAMHDAILLDGVYVYDYSMDPELEGDGSSGKIEPIAVFAHEYTHLLGMPDLYDYDSKLVASTFTIPGDANDHPLMDWCIMGYGGYGLSSYGKGSTPTHHCAYTKKLLGWLEPVTLGLSQTDIQVPEIETYPVAYQVPINGSDSEYFLIENRNSASTSALFDHFDSDFSAWFNWFTPGSNPLDAGLIIYHIDETMPLNDGTPDYPHYGCRVIDAGYTIAQPWPTLEFTEWWYPYEFRIGAAFCTEDAQSELTPLTDPNSDGYTGPSGIYITNISASGAQMTFDLSFGGGSVTLECVGSSVLDSAGDEDGFADANETVDLYITVKNTGSLPAMQVSGSLWCSDANVTIIENTATYPDIGVSFDEQNGTPFSLTVSPTCPAGYDTEMDLLVSWNGGSLVLQVPIELNWDIVFADDMESGVGSWTHNVAWGSYNDQWHRSTIRNHTPDGDYSWKCGQEGSGAYTTLLNAALQTPLFNLPENARLSFWHRLNCEEEWDGAILQIGSSGNWTSLIPDSGYPDLILHSNAGGPFAVGTPCYSSDFNWSYFTADLTGILGEKQIRFIFGSDQGVGEEGWYIDDFRIYAPQGSVGISTNEIEEIPANYTLYPAFPNPFNAETLLRFSLPNESFVTLQIVDIQGRLVKSLQSGSLNAGFHTLRFSGESLPSGVYLANLKAGAFSQTQKLLLIK
ncbi:MAG: M6 family metalloprotease domain-containing protein [bacterium]